MVGIVLVSHSRKLAEGLQELVGQLAQGQVAVAAAGGGPDGGLGTSAATIGAAIQAVAGGDGVLVMVDLGSAILSTELAIEMLDPVPAGGVQVSDAPFVEGAVVATIHAGLGNSLAEVAAAAAEARNLPKNLA